MAKYNESICRGCFHSYVCEQFNEHRDDDNKKCHFFNDHFVPTADVVEVSGLTPCDVCAYNPPSSCDGKPCCICPATAKMDGKGEGE
jgi:hypothetical protein